MRAQRFDYTDFNRIRIERALTVDVLQANSYSVTIGDDFSRIRLEKIGETLCIERRGIDWFAPFHGRPHIVITMPTLLELTMAGACQGKAIGFQSNNNLMIKLTGACQAEIHAINAVDVKVEILGASNLAGDINYSGSGDFKVIGASRAMLHGTGNTGRIELGGASQVRFSGLAMRQAEVSCTGASNAQIRVSEHLDVLVAGASKLDYAGNPIIGRIQVAGASSINHR